MVVYEDAMKIDASDVQKELNCYRARAAFDMLVCLKKDNVFPGILAQEFKQDIQNVIDVVHGHNSINLYMEKMTESQKVLTFAIAHLRNEFSRK